MKIRSTRTLALPALLLAFATAGFLTFNVTSKAQTKPDKDGASGHGAYSVGTKQNRQFSFSAVRHQDGTVSGNAVIQNPSLSFRGHIEVSCLRVTPNAPNPLDPTVIGTRADMGGVVRNSNDPSIPDGTSAFFTVFDNGEPGKDADTISPVFFDFVVGPQACQNILGDATAPSNQVQFPITAGNIQVRP